MYSLSLSARLTRRPALKSVFAAVCAGLFAPAALAVPPSFTGQPITLPIPGPNNTVIVNLRQQGVITGSAPIGVNPTGAIFINGVLSSSALAVTTLGNGDPGAVCFSLTNINFALPTTDTIEVELSLVNLAGENAGPRRVRVNDGAAPTVGPNDSQQLALCDDPNQSPVVNAGTNRTVTDTDGAPGESVTLQGSATDPEGEALTYVWYRDGEFQIATGATPTVTLQDGVNTLTLQATDEGGATGFATVVITVSPDVAPAANAGGDRTVADTDRKPGENVTLDGTASTDSDGTIVSYAWFRQPGADANEESLGSGATLVAALPDGPNTIRLQVTDNAGNTGSTVVVITVGVVPDADVLSEIPNLTPNQMKVAQAVDRVCSDLSQLQANETALTADQRDLLTRCDGLLINNSAANQVEALDELVTDDFAVARTQTLLFANTQYMSIMDRLIALRGGARGLSLAGLNIVVDGKMVPLAQLQEMAQELFGGGASSDADEPGGLLSDKWGLWARGNYSFGEKDSSPSSPSFDADQWSLVGGIDYRLSDRAVLGGSLAYGNSSVEFNPSSEGALDTASWAASLYGSMYAAKNFYLDAIVNVANSSYEAERNITYSDGLGLVNADASGDTDGLTLSGGLSGGYDFLLGGLTVSPSLGFFYIDAAIDGFTEQGAGGLNLIYDEQKFKSLTGNLGFRITYAWNVSWGVLLPHLRVDYVREFENDADVFGVRFAADPNANSTPPILIETDNPDQSYWRFATGFSAQFKYGFSGYIEYQRLESFEFISFQDVSIGLRMQRSF